MMPWPEPQLIEGKNSLSKLPQMIKNEHIKNVLIVTDEDIISLGLMDHFLVNLRNENINYVIYDQVISEPTIENIEEAKNIYIKNNCQGIVAFGGGSPIDCAKIAGARIVKPNKEIEKMKGLLKVLKKLPPLFVVPTTAGTGAEATLAAVFTKPKTYEKYPIMDFSLIPQYAVLDPLLTMKLPPHITAATGMDALTHAIEAYIGKSNTKKTKQWSIKATQLIFANLYEAYRNGHNVAARQNMLKAAHLAGKAFTKAYVGYVHAIAHTVGGFYNLPHGLANAIILPYVLEYYGSSIHKPLAELADLVGISQTNDSSQQRAEKFIEAIKDLNRKLNIPTKITDIRERDIPVMVNRALNEGNPLYPVPKILFKEDMSKLLQKIKAS